IAERRLYPPQSERANSRSRGWRPCFMGVRGHQPRSRAKIYGADALRRPQSASDYKSLSRLFIDGPQLGAGDIQFVEITDLDSTAPRETSAATEREHDAVVQSCCRSKRSVPVTPSFSL